jgi:formate dehydrogenase maturation protein FdhE
MACKKYIKTVDLRDLTRPVHPFLEQVSTLHLDMLAEKQGLTSGLPLWLQT